MTLSLLKNAVATTKFSDTHKQTIKKLEESIGADLTKVLIETYQVTPDDYAKWLQVIIGYAQDENLNISKKGNFLDVAGAVLENDPQPIDFDMQEAIMNTLWKNYQASKSHEKVQKVLRAKEEEEQLKYAIDKMKNPNKSVEDEESDFDVTNTHAYQWNNNPEYRKKQQQAMAIQQRNDNARRNSMLLQQALGRGVDPDNLTNDEILYKLKQAASYINDPQDADMYDDLIAQYEEDEEKLSKPLKAAFYSKQLGQHYVRDKTGNIRLVNVKPGAKIVKDPRSFENEEHWDEEAADRKVMRGEMSRTEFDRQKRNAQYDKFMDEMPDKTDSRWNRNKAVENEEFDDEYDPREYNHDKLTNADYDLYDQGEDLDQELPFDYEEGGDFEDPRDTDLKDQQLIKQGQQIQNSRDLENFDPVSTPKSKPKTFYAAEQEEVGKKDYSSPFRAGQTVICKKDKNLYVVKIPDGPGDQVGILVGSRIQMVPSKDLEAYQAKEEEEFTSKRPSNRSSFLHDLLTGENSKNHLATIQKTIEDEAANAWTQHHAKMPKNPHPKGSIAYKAWEKGMTQAAKNVWAPKKVEDAHKSNKKTAKKK